MIMACALTLRDIWRNKPCRGSSVRPLKRVIQQIVLDPLAYKIIAGEITDGAKVAVDVEGDALAFKTLEYEQR